MPRITSGPRPHSWGPGLWIIISWNPGFPAAPAPTRLASNRWRQAHWTPVLLLRHLPPPEMDLHHEGFRPIGPGDPVIGPRPTQGQDPGLSPATNPGPNLVRLCTYLCLLMGPRINLCPSEFCLCPCHNLSRLRTVFGGAAHWPTLGPRFYDSPSPQPGLTAAGSPMPAGGDRDPDRPPAGTPVPHQPLPKSEVSSDECQPATGGPVPPPPGPERGPGREAAAVGSPDEAEEEEDDGVEDGGEGTS